MSGDTTVAIGLIEDARAKVKAMVDRMQRQTGSRMYAYEIVGQRIFKSRDWVRAFCAASPHAKPDVVIFNINEAYRRLGNVDGTTDGHATRTHRTADTASRYSGAADPVIAALARLARNAGTFDPAYREAIVIVRASVR